MTAKLVGVMVITLIAAAGTASGVSALVSSSPAATTYYACLSGGTLSKVGTTAPTCTLPAVPISWYSAANSDTKVQVSSAISAANGGLCVVPKSGTVNADLHGCNLSDKNLSSLSLPGVNFKGANLAGADLGGATLTDANLWGTNLVGASLTGANLSGANLTGADLAAVDLTGATIGSTGTRPPFLPAFLNGANLTGAVLTNARFSGTSLLNADLTGAVGLSSATWQNAICPDEIRSNTIGNTCVGHTSGISAANSLALGGQPASSYQQRVTGTCTNGAAITGVNADGSATCSVNHALTSGKVAIAQGSTANLLSANGMSLTAVCDPTKGESVELSGAVVLSADSSVGGHVGGLASSATLETLPLPGGTDRGSFNASNNTGSLDGTWLVSSLGTGFNCVAEASGLFSG